jgi:chromosome partitioning protein
MPHVVAVLNTKGGAGKSTLATNLARAFQQDGHSVLIVDSDPQGTARDWRETGGDIDLPAVFGVDRPTLDIDIPKIAHAFDVIVIDGAAKMTKMAVSAIKAADLVLIPVQPSAADLWAVNDLVDMIEARQQLTEGRPRAAFVINRQILGTRLAGGVDEVLASYGVPVLESRTSQRVAYSEAMAAGLTVLDYEPEGKAAEEIRNLYNELKEHLDG